MFFEYIWLAWYGTSAGGFDGPMIVTPLWTTISSGLVSSQLPPRSAARSTITDPGAIASTISVVTRIGARLPGISAVVMTTSLPATTFEHHLALAAVERLRPAPWRSRPCPRRRPVSSGSSTNRAPRLCTCSLTAGRTS